MAIQLPFKLSKSTVALILSFILNLLGGTGVVRPLVDLSSKPPPAPSAAPAGPSE